MEWLDITGPRQVSSSCISRIDWTSVVLSQPTYELSNVSFLDPSLYGETIAEPQQLVDPTYATRIEQAKLLVTGITWYEAAIWCNALSSQLGIDPAYTLNGTVAHWVPATSRVNGKKTLTDLELISGSKGVRLLRDNDRKVAMAKPGFVSITGIHEWGEDRRRASFIYESMVFKGEEMLQCNSIFALPWNSFRVIKG